MSKWKPSKKFPNTCAVACGEDHVGFAQFYNDMNHFIERHNSDCDAYEARIAELTAQCDELIQAATESDFVKWDGQRDAEAALARARAESLRVVPDGEPVPVSALCAGDLLRCDYPGIWQKHGDINSGLTYIMRLDTESPQGTALTHAASVQPVRLENWEAGE